jgi:putative ABC transport system substrate-binding protein
VESWSVGATRLRAVLQYSNIPIPRLRLCLVLCALLHALCSSPAAQQQTGKVARIGFLDGSTASGSAVLWAAFRQELRKLGWIEGKNIVMEYRFAEQKLERLPELAADLVRLKFDLIVVVGTPAALAAKRVTTTIPIVIASGGDPVGAGLIGSLARSGGNVTGLSTLGELNTKRLEILQGRRPPARPRWISVALGRRFSR